jgi:two-component SAPR family response regulator
MVDRTDGRPEKLRVLIVEDHMLVAMELEYLVEAIDGEVAASTPTLAKARAAIEEDNIDLALLDVSVDDEPVFPLAEELRQRGIPYIFSSGYDRHEMAPEEFQDDPWLLKPVGRDDLARAVDEIFASR